MNLGWVLLAASDGRGWQPDAVDAQTMRTVFWGYGILLLLGFAANGVMALRLAVQPQRWMARQARVVRRRLATPDLMGFLLFLLTCFWAGLFLQFLLAAWMGPARAEQAEGWLMALHSVTFHWAALLGLVWLLARRRRSWHSVFGLAGRHAPRDVVLGAFGYVAMIPFVLFFAAIYQYALHSLGYELSLQEVAQAITRERSILARTYLYAVAVILAPVAEELLFRGVGLPELMKRMGVGPAVFTLSVLFSVIHLHVPGLVPLFVVSVALCVAYVRTGSILVPIVMHALFNGVNLWILGAVQ